MPSNALKGLQAGLEEVRALRKLSPVRDTLARGPKASTARAHGRASVVLLSGHYERYIRALNEEALAWFKFQDVKSSQVPDEIKLRHSKVTIDKIATASWNNRKQMLIDFSMNDSLLWDDSATPALLDHTKVLYMKSPKSEEVKKFFAMYGIPDIFAKATRKTHRRSHLWLKLQEMVDKRNNIAHGDFTTEALPSEIMSYIDSVGKFCETADRVFSAELKRIAKSSLKPW